MSENWNSVPMKEVMKYSKISVISPGLIAFDEGERTLIEKECRLCRPIGLSPQVVSPHRSYLAPTSKLCRPNIEVVSPQGSVRNLE